MTDRQQEFRVGVVALAIAGIASTLLVFNTGVSVGLGGSPYAVQVRLDRAPGVGPNTPVRKDGVLIGRVASVDFLPQGGVLVTANIQPGAPIYRSDQCVVRPSSLFGDAEVSFIYAGDGADPVPLEPEALIEGRALADPIEALTSLQVDIAPTIASIGDAAEGVSQLMDRVNAAVGDDFDPTRVNTLMDELTIALRQFRQTMDTIDGTMQGVDRLVEDPRVEQGLADLPALIAEARGTVTRATETLDSFGSVVESAELNLKNLEGLTAPLGERGPEISQLLISSIEKLDKTLADASAFVETVVRSEGSLNKLLTDPLLYQNVVTVVYNADEVIRRLGQRVSELRPILHDIRAFTDKIAREPGRLVGGALNRGPGLK